MIQYNRHDLTLKNTIVDGYVCPRCGSEVIYRQFDEYNSSHIEISCDKCLCTVAPCKFEEFKRAEKMLFSSRCYKFIADISREYHEIGILVHKDGDIVKRFKNMSDIDYNKYPCIYRDFGNNINEWIYLLRYVEKIDKQEDE